MRNAPSAPLLRGLTGPARYWHLVLLFACLGAFALPARAQDCLGSYTLTYSPPPDNGTYECGQTVTFCLTINDWNTTNANWLHGIVPHFGPGWDLSTVTPTGTPHTVGTSGGTWGWYNVDNGTAGTAIGPVGPGFFFDLDNDGNPGNNFGDYATVGPWTFCWTVTVASGADCVGGADLTVTVETYGDSETGSWGSAGCHDDEVPSTPPLNVLNCPNAGVGYSVVVCQTDPPQDLFTGLGGTPDPTGTWTAPDGSPSSGTLDPATGLSGPYSYTVTPSASNCEPTTAVVDVTINTPPNAGSNGALRICERAPLTDLFPALNGMPDMGGTWVGPDGASMNGTVDPLTASDGDCVYTVAGVPPCASTSATVSLIVDHMPDPGTSTTTTHCPDEADFDLFPLLGPTALAGGVWTAPDGSTVSNMFDPGVSDAGPYTYTLHGADACAAETISAIVNVVMDPAPSAIFTFTPDKGCIPLPVFFQLKSATGIVSAHWSFGDAYTSTDLPRADHTYNYAGSFPPSVQVTDLNGCKSTWTPRDPIRVYPPPSADFHYTPFPLRTLFVTDATFLAWQGGLDAYNWTIAGEPLQGPTVKYHFPEATATTYTVCLDVVDSIGCRAEHCDSVVVHESFNVSVPNAFTPNGDGDNDVFRPVMLGMDVRSLSMQVFDRWGSLVYSSTAPDMGWNGGLNNDATVLPEGVYVWKIAVQNALTAEREDLIGHVTLLK